MGEGCRAGMARRDAPRGGRNAHPRDRDPPTRSVEILPDRARNETLRGVAVVAGTGVFESAEQELDARIAPTGPRPSPEHGIAVVELVGPETDLSTIVGGNETLTGAFLQASSRSPPAPVAADAVEFVLEAGPGITWRKVLSIADGRGGMWDVVTQDQ